MVAVTRKEMKTMMMRVVITPKAKLKLVAMMSVTLMAVML